MVAAFFAVLPLALHPPALQGQEAAGTGVVRVDSVAVVGNERVSTATILGTIAIESGTEVTYLDVQDAIKRLWATGQFRDVEVTAEGTPTDPESPVTLVFDVEEQDLVRRVEFRGLENVRSQTVMDTTGLREGAPYSPQAVAEARTFIRRALAEKGIPFARIDERREPIGNRVGEIVLVLDVTEGHRVTIADIVFHGNERASGESLQEVMETDPEGFLWFQPGTFDPEILEADLQERLPAYYSSRGHIDFAVVSDTIVVDPETGKARLEITVDEGPQYRLSEFTVEGNRVFPTDELTRRFRTRQTGLLQRLGIREGEPQDAEPVFDAEAFDAATQSVQQLYANEGYIYASIVPVVERLEAAEGEDPRVAIAWQIEEGQPAYVRRVSIQGNEYTWERVIRDKIFILPGDVYSQDRVIQSYQSISSLGFFEAPMPFPSIVPTADGSGDVDITFQVEEKQTGAINFGTTVGGGTGLSGFLGYDQPNLFGQGKEGHLRWDFGRYLKSFEISYSDPNLLNSLISGSVSLFDSRDRFYTFRTGQRKRTGASLRFGIPVPSWVDPLRRTRLFLGYSLARTRYELREGVDDTSLFGRPPGTLSTLSVGLTRSTLNHPLFPTIGSRQSLDTEFSGGPLGGDGEFIKQTFEGSWWVPVGSLGGGEGSRGIRLALGLSVRGGAIFGNARDFPFDRFWMGGVQFGEHLRGYDETTITPIGFVAEGAQIADINRLGDAFLSLTAEYAVRLNDNLSTSLFFDAGNVWVEPSAIDPTQLFRGAGIGVQLVTPFGPIGLDYAYGFDQTDPGWKFHFRMGPMF